MQVLFKLARLAAFWIGLALLFRGISCRWPRDESAGCGTDRVKFGRQIIKGSAAPQDREGKGPQLED